ncbi:MAG: acyl carrier protein [Deltaproteobacteria bacterium]|jgi:acyl carrier protein|nr:acyl carrier protein [Deltaproteobacteria bacterium]
MSEEILDRIRKVVSHQLAVEPSEIMEESSFQDDLGADSLDLVEIVMGMEEEFQIKIDDEVVQSIKTVKDALDFISKHQS